MSERPHRRLQLTQATRSDNGEAGADAGTPSPFAEAPPLSTARPAFLLVPVGEDAAPSVEATLQSLSAGRRGEKPRGNWLYAAGGAAGTAALLVAGWVLSGGLIAKAKTRVAPPAPAAAVQPADARPDEPATPVVLPRTDGLLVLRPAEAEAVGQGIHRADTDIGYWNSPDAYVTWTVNPRTPGRYAVHLTYACGGDSGGRYVLQVANQQLSGESRDTGGWEQFQTVRAGVVRLNSGPTELRVRPDGPIRTALMRLQQVKLYPVPAGHPAGDKRLARQPRAAATE
jgi:hypothetical protein